jgi:RNA polymerase sigma-70 factor (ECF subfamily)
MTIEQAILETKDGNASAFRVIYDEYVKIIYNFVYQRVGHAQMTEDLVSDIFIKVYRNIASFQSGTNLKAWMLTMSRNMIIDHWRKYKHQQNELAFDETFMSADSLHGFFEHIDETLVGMEKNSNDANETAVAQHLNHLKVRERDVITKRYLHSHSVKETAQSLGISESNVKVITHRALKKLALACV